jgi:hypothetical protein
MTKATAITATYQQFAEGIGRTDRMTLEASLAWHKEYLTLDAEKQSDWRYDFVLNYVIGKLDCTPKQAEDICAKTRVQRTANQEKAVNCGSKRFAEHISRTTSRSGKKVDVKFTREQVQACDNALASFKADKLSEQIKMLRAYLTSLEAK